MYVQRDDAGKIIGVFVNPQKGFAEEFVVGASIEFGADKIKFDKVAIVQSHIDSTAKSIGYDNIITAISYADEPAVPHFQIEGRALRAWRSLVWAKCNEIMSEVANGKQDIPTDEQLIYFLPKFTMPKV